MIYFLSARKHNLGYFVYILLVAELWHAGFEGKLVYYTLASLGEIHNLCRKSDAVFI